MQKLILGVILFITISCDVNVNTQIHIIESDIVKVVRLNRPTHNNTYKYIVYTNVYWFYTNKKYQPGDTLTISK